MQVSKTLKVSRDRPFTATKSKETRNKILAQENTKDSGMIKVQSLLLSHNFSRLVAMIKPKVGFKLYQLSHIKIFSVLLCQNLIPCFLTFCSSEKSIPACFLDF